MSSIADARQAVLAALAELRAVESSGSAQDRIDGLAFHRMPRRQSQHDSLALIAGLERDGEFAARGVRPAEAVADIERCKPREARRLVAVAGGVFPTTLDGQPLQPALPATATALGGWEIDLGHAEVIESALGSPPARRLDPARWSGAEAQLADWARTYRPDELARLAAQLLERLDQDGPPPNTDEPRVNELSLTRAADGVGGRIKGRLDAATFEVLARAIRAGLKPEADEHKTLAERQADALGEICEHALDDGRLPTDGGERPHITAILDYDRLAERAPGAVLEFGGRISPAELRRILCDAKITPAVFDGESQPLGLGRENRCVTPAQRKAIAARERGCAHPGCDRSPSGAKSTTSAPHRALGRRRPIRHRQLRHALPHPPPHDSPIRRQSGWIIRMRDGRPEFIPPKWLDATQTARRKPFLVDTLLTV